MRRILILSPHPDDEVVGFAARIGRTLAFGAEIQVLHLSDGVPAPELMNFVSRRRRPVRVARRREEARLAAERLGVGLAGFSARPSRRLASEFEPALDCVLSVLEDWPAEELWCPAYEGGHQDHDAACLLARVVKTKLESTGRPMSVWEAPFYGGWGGRMRAQEFVPDGLSPLLLPSAPCGRLVLTAEEASKKASLLALYGSESGNLGHIRTQVERLRPLAAYDFTKPPHPGRPLHARFRWVPIPLARLDFSDPAENLKRLSSLSAKFPAASP